MTDPNNVEAESVLIARARALHPETDFGENFQSRFHKAPTDGATVTLPAQPVAVAGCASCGRACTEAGTGTRLNCRG